MKFTAIDEEKKSEKKKKTKSKDVFNSLGFGFTAYFKMVWVFIVLFVVLTLINLPVMLIYKT